MIRTEEEAGRLVEIVDEYLAQRRAGRAPPVSELLRRHPRFAEDLRNCLGCLEIVDRGLAEAKPEDPLSGILGDFRIIREVGRGGMGVVYEAEQVSLGRRVALKVLPFAAVFDDRHLQRFRNEAQAAAFLHHTNIVPVHAVGCERGVHYYAMQYIEGRSLAQIVEELKRDPLEPSQPLSVITKGSATRSAEYCRAVARLGIQAAEALAHAHERGVIHRDIKPANLLVDALGHLWVTDFGLASFERNLGLTLTGDLLGTVRYMSPEQALAKRVPVDHRTDVYSLGVTLYELLTLEAAFPGTNPQEVMQAIAFRDPAPPRKCNPAIPLDLETVLLKAMAKDPGDRYTSADDLAADLRRFLNHEAVRAKRPSILARVQKWARRHRAWAAASVAVLLFALAGSLVALAAIQRRERVAVRARESAEASLESALEAIDQTLSAVADDSLEGVPGMTEVRLGLLRNALSLYRKLADEHEGDPRLQRATALGLLRAARLLAEAGGEEDMREAEAGLREAMALHERLEDPVGWATASNALARVLYYSRREDLAHRQWRETYDRLAGEGRESDVLAARATAARGLWYTLPVGAPDRQEFIGQAVAWGRELAATRGTRDDRFHLAVTLNAAAMNEPHLERSGELFAEATEILEGLHREAPADQELGSMLALLRGNLANNDFHLGYLDEARRLSEESVRELRRLALEFPRIGAHRENLAFFLRNLGDCLHALGEPDEAGRAYAEAHSLYSDLIEERYGRERPYEMLSDIEVRQGRLRSEAADADGAERLLGSAIARAEDGPRLHALSWALRTRARLRWSQGRDAEARDDWARGVAALEEIVRIMPGGARGDVGEAESAWILLARQAAWCPDPALRDGAAAKRYAEEAVRLEPNRAAPWRALGAARYRAGEFETALDALREARRLGPSDDPLLGLLTALAKTALGQEDAAEWYDRAIARLQPHQRILQPELVLEAERLFGEASTR